jgi:hypothetical protein
MPIAWPYDTLTPRQERARLQGVGMTGGQSVGGTSQTIRMGGGGLWVIEQTFLATGSGVKLARALGSLLDGGATDIVVRVSEQTYGPAGLVASEGAFSDGSEFSDGSGFATVPPGGITTASAALRATTLTVTALAGAFQGGERFSIDHATKGRRLYEVVGVSGEDLTIRPPLREAVASGVYLDFLQPGVVCRLANADEFMGGLAPDRIAEVTAVWVEAT